MFKHVLVPLDGSERAERALPLVARLAAAAHGSILLVRVAAESLYLSAAYGYTSSESPEDVTSEAEAYLNKVAARPELAAFPVETLVAIGTPAAEILEAARARQVDAIVMCSHGRTGLARWALGSVAQKVARHAPVPVLVLKEGAPLPASLVAEPAHDPRVLIPLDGSPIAEAAMAPAITLAASLAIRGAAELHLLRIVDPTTISGRAGVDADPDQTLRADITRSAEDYLNALAQQVRDQLPGMLQQATVTWSVAASIDAAATIVETAEGHAAHAADTVGSAFDLIAMATHGRSGIGLWAVGSVTERVLTSSALPLLIVRPPHDHSGAELAATAQVPASLPPLL